jgi:predicted small lipoprotein YifL
MRSLFVLAVALSLAACGSKPKPATTPEAALPAVETESAAPDDGSDDDASSPNRGTSDEEEAKADPCGGGE